MDESSAYQFANLNAQKWCMELCNQSKVRKEFFNVNVNLPWKAPPPSKPKISSWAKYKNLLRGKRHCKSNTIPYRKTDHCYPMIRYFYPNVSGLSQNNSTPSAVYNGSLNVSMRITMMLFIYCGLDSHQISTLFMYTRFWSDGLDTVPINTPTGGISFGKLVFIHTLSTHKVSQGSWSQP